MKIRANIQKMKPYAPGLQPQEKGWVKLNTNESPYPPSLKVVAAVTKEAKNLRLYPDPQATELRSALARRFKLSKNQVLLGNGSDELLDLVLRAFQPKRVVGCDPSYGMYSVKSQLNNLVFKKVLLMGDFSIPLSKLSKENNAIIFLCNPNSPTGIYVSNKEIEALCKNKSNLIVVDEAYGDFAPQSAVSLIQKYNNLLVFRTFSKSYGLAGIRLGYALGNAKLIAVLNKISDPYNVDRLALVAGLAALKDQAYFKRNIKRIKSERARVSKKLKSLGSMVYPSQANFVFVKPKGVTAKKLYSELKKQKILVRYWDSSSLKDYARITIGTQAENTKLLNAIKEIL